MMNMNMKVEGADELLLKIRHAAEKVPDRSRKVMHRQAEKLIEWAQKMTPEDDAYLTDSIHAEKSYETRGRLTISVVAGGVVRGKDVDRYAALIHEHYESMKPGPITELKRLIYPEVYVGSKFLDRAAEKVEPKLEAALIEVVTTEMMRLAK